MEGATASLIADAAPAPRLTSSLLASAAIASFGAAQFGFAIGVLNEPQGVIESDLNIPDNSFKWSAVNAAFTVAAFFGAQLLSSYVDRLGRRGFMIMYQIFFAVGGALGLVAGLIKSQQAAAYALLLISRVVVGLGVGGATVVVPLYLGEIAPSSLKGAFGTLNQFTVTALILVAQALGLGMSTSSLWPWMVAIHGFGGILGMAAGLLLVESPRWLITRDREDEARRVLVKLRGYDSPAHCDAEIHEIQAASASTKGQAAPSMLQVFRDPSLRWPIIIMITLQVAQQLSGINAVMFYSSSFFKDAGVSNPSYGTLATGAVNFLATGMAVYLIDKAGRKPLLLWGSIGMLLSAIALTITLVIKDGSSVPANTTSILSDVSIAFVLLFVIFFEIGLGPIPWLIGGEMLSEGPRATGMSIGAATNWFFTTVVALCFPAVQKALGDYSFVPFIVFITLTVVFTFIYVPETRGRTPAEVGAWLNRGKTHAADGAEGEGQSAALLGSVQHPTA